MSQDTETRRHGDTETNGDAPSPPLRVFSSPCPRVSVSWPLAALIGGAIAIGFAPILVRLSETAPVATAFWRLLLAQPLLWLWFSREKRSTPQNKTPATRADFWRLAAAGLFFTGDLAAWHWSITLTSVANATLEANFAPVFVVIFSWLLWRQRVTRPFLLGMAVAMGGVFFLLGESASFGAKHLRGDALGLLTAAFYAAYLLSVKRLRDEFSTSAIMAWSGVFNTLALLIVALLMGGQFFPHTPQGWLVVIALAVVSHVGGQSLIAYALAHLPATFGSLGLLVQPVAAAILAWGILGEAIGWRQLAGGALVLAGIMLARRS